MGKEFEERIVKRVYILAGDRPPLGAKDEGGSVVASDVASEVASDVASDMAPHRADCLAAAWLSATICLHARA